MRRFVYSLGFPTVALFLLSVGNVAKADTVDPVIGIRGCTGSCSQLIGPSGSFSFTFTGTMGLTITEQDFPFLNNTGSTVGELDLVVPAFPSSGPTAPALTYMCGDASTYFSNCLVTPIVPTVTTGTLLAPVVTEYLIRYFGGPGIPNDPNPLCDETCTPSVPAADFLIFVQPLNNDLSNISPNDTYMVNGQTIPAPEPATIALLSTGLGVLGISRRRKKQAA
jgi:hypothetical protein